MFGEAGGTNEGYETAKEQSNWQGVGWASVWHSVAFRAGFAGRVVGGIFVVGIRVIRILVFNIGGINASIAGRVAGGVGVAGSVGAAS